MGFPSAKMGQSSNTKSSIERCNILVVDDDPTSLVVVSTLLRSWQYEVRTVKSPLDALATVRIQVEEIDLVVTDLHMPQMSGLELQQEINADFKLPVIIMSSDDRENMILKCLQSGAVFYIQKPVSQNDLKNVWQYAVQYKKGKSILIERTVRFQGRSSWASREKTAYYDEDIASASSVNEDNRGSSKKVYCKRKTYSKRGKECLLGDNSNVAPKKAKVVWTTSLHNRFLQAIKHITLEKAVPKRILECMNVPGLTRENVASHLQKYRIFLKKVAEKGASAVTKKFSSRNFRSNYGSGQSSLLLKNSQYNGNQQSKTSSKSTYGNNYMSTLNLGNYGATRGASTSNSVSQLGLLGNQANLRQPFSSFTNPTYQANSTTFGVGSNDYIDKNLLLSGGMSRDPVNGMNPMQIYQQQSQGSWFGLYNNFGASSHNYYRAAGSWERSYSTLGNENMETFNNPYSNYGELFGVSQTGVSANGIDGGNGLINGAQNKNMSAAGAMGIPPFAYLAAPGESSSLGFVHASYQFPPAFGNVNEQGNASVQLPTQPQQQYVGLGNDGQTDFGNFDLMNNVFGNSAHPNPFAEGDISGSLFGPTNYQFPYQQGGEGFLMNPNFPSTSYHAEVNPPTKLSLNAFASHTVEENDPWISEPSLDQLQNIQEAVNGELDNVTNPFNDYYPSFDANPNDQHEGDNDDHINSELMINLNVVDNYASGNQDWDDEFLDSLFGCDRPT